LWQGGNRAGSECLENQTKITAKLLNKPRSPLVKGFLLSKHSYVHKLYVGGFVQKPMLSPIQG